MLEIEVVQGLNIVPQLRMLFIVEQKPVQFGGKIPFLKLPEFLAHEKQLLARVRHHIAIKNAQSRKFFLITARHFVDHGALSVHHLVVRDRQDIVL